MIRQTSIGSPAPFGLVAPSVLTADTIRNVKSLAGLLALLLLPAVAGAKPVALVGPKVDVVCSDMAVAANGSAVVGWGEGQETITLVAASRARRRHPVKVALGSVDGSFPVVQTLGHVREATCPQLATDASGNAIAAWEDDRGRVRVAERQANSRFGAARAVSGRKSAELSVASAASGAAAIAWLSRRGKIEVIVRQPGAPFAAPVALPATEPAALEVAVNERGSVLVTDEEDHSRARVWLSQAGRHFGPAEGIPGSALLTSYVTTALGADDSVVALLNGPRGHETGIDVTFRPPGARFAAPRPLTRSGDFARVAADAAGNFTAAWTAYTGDGHPAGV
ncbi:MAG: hypothetical protein QOI80_1155, partial [Solirubrobacteraceae bacterium]|nr:hypothetical protein [Solirubrobacteraceae bacterium]